MHNGTRDRVQTCLTMVGGIPTNLSHERTPWGVSTEQARSVPGGGFLVVLVCGWGVAWLWEDWEMRLTCNLIR